MFPRCAVSVLAALLFMAAQLFMVAPAQARPDEDEPAALVSLRDAREVARALDSMSPIERDRLQRMRTQFESLSAEEQDRMRQLHQQLWESPDGQRLFGVLERYRDWLTTLSAGQRDDLLALSAEHRVAAIGRMKAEQDAKRFAEQAPGLTQSDAQAVGRWLRDYLVQNAENILQQLPDEVERHIRSVDNKQRQMKFLTMVAIRHQLLRHLPPPRPEELQQLLKSLSPAARQHLESLDSTPDRLAMVRGWIEANWNSRFRYSRVTDEQLEKFYMSLPADEQEQLDRLPAPELQASLRRLYHEQRMMRRPPSPPGRRPEAGGPRPPRFDGQRGPPPPQRGRRRVEDSESL
jgi:hypothetical protein